MAPPFKLNPAPRDSGIVRLPDGKFAARVVPLSPPEVVRRSSDRGVDVREVIEENRATEHDRPVGSPPTSSEIPWGPAGPFNDAGKPPFRLKP
jgi:hypothetical protein